MATEEEIEDIVEKHMEAISEDADDTGRFTQEESVEIYEGIAADCEQWAKLIRSEMEGG